MTVLKKEVIKEPISENENNQEIVHVESEPEDENIPTNLGALPTSSIFSELMTKTLGSLMSCSNSLRIKASPSGPTIPGFPFYTLGGAKLRIQDSDYDLTPKIYKALSSTSYSGKNMKDGNDILMMNNV